MPRHGDTARSHLRNGGDGCGEAQLQVAPSELIRRRQRLPIVDVVEARRGIDAVIDPQV